MPAQIVPVTNAPRQSCIVSLNIDGGVCQLQLGFRLNPMAGYWILSISDQQGNLLRDSIPMLTGTWPASNILGDAAYLKIGSAFIVNVSNDSSDTQDYPGPNDFGTGGSYLLLWDDTPGYVASS